MFKTCGNIVFSLLKCCEVFSTRQAYNIIGLLNYVNNHQFFNKPSITNQQSYPHQKITNSPLFEQVFYPVSTTPITIRTKLRKDF